ncbi:putative disco-interacting protein 2-like C [Apostichopus japonicus]|uniref:Putative disco-interacting protein 2-like C n=1 Tax=Stichopus japonicus TaxID=307972 RepID=A0A2G8LL61_STIJA|nr:putative disco-interacting protein 2-like C [Apostichopus japonicus]
MEEMVPDSCEAEVYRCYTSATTDAGGSVGGVKRQVRNRRRAEHHEPENRYRSDVREEAVKAALANHIEQEMPCLQRGSPHASVVPTDTPPESDTDDNDSISSSSSHQLGEPSGAAVGSFYYVRGDPFRHTNNGHVNRAITEGVDIATSAQPPPDVTASSGLAFQRGGTIEDPHISARVSSKIQQLLNTLKRPKRKPLQDFFVEEDDELEIHLSLKAFQMDPNAPRPEGNVITPAIGDQLHIPTGFKESRVCSPDTDCNTKTLSQLA